MSSIPYNYGKYIDDVTKMTQRGAISSGEQQASPSSAGSRGLAKTTQFTKDRTQMQMGHTPIAESMVEIRNILNRIDGINAPVQEDDGEQALANDLALFFAKRSKELLQSMERPDKNDQEYEEFVDIAQAFKKGIQAGLDEVNMSDFEFSNNPFGDFGRGIDDGPDEELVDILNQHGYQPGPDGANDKATIVKQKEESVSEDAGEGHMSKSTLYHTAKYAIELMQMIKPGDDLEGWVQSKLNKAADYLQGVYNYEEYQKLNPYREELDASLMQKHAQVVQKNIDEILAKETKLDDIDTKPGMMRILAKRVNEVEKNMAKENRKNTDEAHGGQHTTSGRSMTKGEMNKREKIVKGMKKDKAGFKKRYGKDAEAVMYATATKQAMK